MAAALALYLTRIATSDASLPAGALGALAMLILVVSLAVPVRALITVTLALLGASYATILVIDNPTLDLRAAVVGAALLATGELAHLAIEARSAVVDEAGTTARRVGSVAIMVLAALVVGGGLIALVDLARTGGLAIEALGVAAAVGAVGLLALATRDARATGPGVKGGQALGSEEGAGPAETDGG